MDGTYIETETRLAQLLGWSVVLVANGKPVVWSAPDGCEHREHERPHWARDSAAAFALMAEHLEGYYEAGVATGDHCLVVPPANQRAMRTVVYFRDHASKEHAVRYAIGQAVIAKLDSAF